MKKKGIIIGIIIAIVVALFCVWFFLLRGGAGSSSGGETAYVTSVGEITGNVTGVQNRYTGVVETQDSIKIKKDSEKTVDEIFVEVGSVVEEGTPLFSYDVEDIQLSLAQAELDVAQAEQTISLLNTQLQEVINEKQYASKDEQLEYTVRIQTIQNDIKKAEYDKKSKELTVQRIKDGLENTQVLSPGAGIVQSINTNSNGNGYDEYGNPQDDAFITIISTGDYRIKGTINEQNMYSIYEGMSMIIHSRVDDTVWFGTIGEISNEPEQNNNNGYYDGGGEQASKYNFYVHINDSTGLLLGQHVYMEADFGQANVKEGIWLYSGYIVDIDGSPYIWAKGSNNKLEKRSVTLGEYDPDMDEYQIASGIELSDYIAWPEENLKEGMKCSSEASVMVVE